MTFSTPWAQWEKDALDACVKRGATLAEAMTETGRTERQIKDRLHNNKQPMPEHWKQPRAKVHAKPIQKGFAFENVHRRGTDRSRILSELNVNPQNPRLELRKFSWQLEEEKA